MVGTLAENPSFAKVKRQPAFVGRLRIMSGAIV